MDDEFTNQELSLYEQVEVDVQPGAPPGVHEGPDEELTAARAHLEGFAGKAPPSAHLRLGRACLFNDRLDEARAAAKEAMALCKDSEDHDSMVSAQALMCDVHLQALEVDDALAMASRALEICTKVRDQRGRATFLSREAVALAAQNQSVEALRAAEKAEKAWREVTNEPGGEVEALVVLAEAKVAICEERGDSQQVNGINLSHLKAAQIAVKAAETWRQHDYGCLGNAHFVSARVSRHLGNWKQAEQSAKAASKAFRKARQVLKRAQALVLWAEADLRRGYLQDARSRASRAQDIFEKVNDQEGLLAVSDVYDGVDKALGIPTRAELAAQAENRRLAEEQQMQYLMWQQHQQQAGLAPSGMEGLQMMSPQMDAVGGPPAAVQRGGGEVIVHKGAPLDVSAMLNEEAVVGRILETVKTLLGEDEAGEIELDIPLMEAGMTSNNAVLMRDFLSKDMPGINLPPTLIFDYPSVGSIAEFIVDKAMALKG